MTTCNSWRSFSILGKRQSLPKASPSLATLWLELRCFCLKINFLRFLKGSGPAPGQQSESECTGLGHGPGAGGNKPYMGNRSRLSFCTGLVSKSCSLVLQLVHWLMLQDTSSLGNFILGLGTVAEFVKLRISTGWSSDILRVRFTKDILRFFQLNPPPLLFLLRGRNRYVTLQNRLLHSVADCLRQPQEAYNSTEISSLLTSARQP